MFFYRDSSAFRRSLNFLSVFVRNSDTGVSSANCLTMLSVLATYVRISFVSFPNLDLNSFRNCW